LSSDTLWDFLIVGSGPAGLGAAVNGRIRQKSVLILGLEGGSERLIKALRLKITWAFRKLPEKS